MMSPIRCFNHVVPKLSTTKTFKNKLQVFLFNELASSLLLYNRPTARKVDGVPSKLLLTIRKANAGINVVVIKDL